MRNYECTVKYVTFCHITSHYLCNDLMSERCLVELLVTILISLMNQLYSCKVVLPQVLLLRWLIYHFSCK